jgi:hypothetical protein
MLKLNGKVYLTFQEVENVLQKVLSKFRTSHRVVLPQKIPYIDRQFIDELRERNLYITLIIRQEFSYYEKHMNHFQLIKVLEKEIYSDEMCETELKFLNYDITIKQKEEYRLKYQNFIVNCFVKECIERINLLLTK